MAGSGLVRLPVFEDSEAGTLAVAEVGPQVPFVIRRIFHMFDMPVGSHRGGHAHRRCQQFLLAMAGRLQVATRSAEGTQTVLLSRPDQGLYVPAMTWLDVIAVDPGSVCLVLASDAYDAADYIHDPAEFDQLVGGG